jgi:hypothetical protein
MKRWEYKHFTDEWSPESELCRLGAEGWRLRAMVWRAGEWDVVMERPLTDSAPRPRPRPIAPSVPPKQVLHA